MKKKTIKQIIVWNTIFNRWDIFIPPTDITEEEWFLCISEQHYYDLSHTIKREVKNNVRNIKE